MNDTTIDIVAGMENFVSRYAIALGTVFPLLTGQQAMLILRLGDRRLTVGQLAIDAYYQTNISYNIARLTDRKLLKMQHDASDRRLRWVSLTAKGKETAAVLKEKHDTLMARCARFLPDQKLLKLLVGAVG